MTNSVSVRLNGLNRCLVYNSANHKFSVEYSMQQERVRFFNSDTEKVDLTNEFLKVQSSTEANNTPSIGTCIITNSCNMDCSFCYAHKNEDPEIIDPKIIKQLKTKLPPESFKYTTISGGEPFLFPGIVRRVREEFENCCIYTNGSLLTSNIVKWLLNTNTSIYVTLDYYIPGFQGHNSSYARKNIQYLVDRYPDLKNLISIGTVIPSDQLQNLQELRKREGTFEKDCWRLYNIVDPIKEYTLTSDFFENELDLIESDEISISSSVFFRYLNYLQRVHRDRFNVSSCSNALTVNHRNELSICNEAASMPSKYNDCSYKSIKIDDFDLDIFRRQQLSVNKYGTHSLCKKDCYLTYICGGICWKKQDHDKELQCHITRLGVAYALYIKANYIQHSDSIQPTKPVKGYK
jgi:MoaA/NifB/PqqE/SkfB family radical SAM enzyme